MIKEATAAELFDCHRVMLLSYKDSARKAGFPERGRAGFTHEELLEACRKGDLLFYASHNDVITGILRLGNIAGESCKIKDIAVLPEHRRKGYGKELLDFAKAKAREMGVAKIELGMFDDNAELKEWYVKNGFISVNTKTYEGSPFVIRIFEFYL